MVLAGQHNTASWIVAAGWADLDRREALHTGHSLAMPGVTALVTTTAVLRLISDGRIGIDAPANDYLRSVRLADDTITVRELLSNTSGADPPQAGPGPGGLLGGLGWLLTARRDIAVHSGAVPGAAAMLLYRIPDNQVYVTMTTRFVPVDSITRRLLRETASGMKLM